MDFKFCLIYRKKIWPSLDLKFLVYKTSFESKPSFTMPVIPTPTLNC